MVSVLSPSTDICHYRFVSLMVGTISWRARLSLGFARDPVDGLPSRKSSARREARPPLFLRPERSASIRSIRVHCPIAVMQAGKPPLLIAAPSRSGESREAR